MAFQIEFSAAAEAVLHRLRHDEYQRVRSAVAEIADLAASAPRLYEVWLKRAAEEGSGLRLELEGFRVFYEIRDQTRGLRVISIEGASTYS
jgi:mRNA-degrading endonuclease RelE of RelBE toxin-antitoxin system